MKAIEFFGVILGILGAFAVANGIMQIGYCMFLASSVMLFATAFKQSNANLMLLQGVFALANLNGFYNFVI